jgi:hypothetical protein
MLWVKTLKFRLNFPFQYPHKQAWVYFLIYTRVIFQFLTVKPADFKFNNLTPFYLITLKPVTKKCTGPILGLKCTQKCTHIFMYGTHYFCQILAQTVVANCSKIPQYQISQPPASQFTSCHMSRDRDWHDTVKRHIFATFHCEHTIQEVFLKKGWFW